jgi:hypothetical protein
MINRKLRNSGNVTLLGRHNLSSIHFEADGTYSVELHEIGDYLINTSIIIIFAQRYSPTLSVV